MEQLPIRFADIMTGEKLWLGSNNRLWSDDSQRLSKLMVDKPIEHKLEVELAKSHAA